MAKVLHTCCIRAAKRIGTNCDTRSFSKFDALLHRNCAFPDRGSFLNKDQLAVLHNLLEVGGGFWDTLYMRECVCVYVCVCVCVCVEINEDVLLPIFHKETLFSLSFDYLPSQNVVLAPSGTYRPNTRGSDDCRGSKTMDQNAG